MSVFVHRLRVRYSECDQQGVVFNGHYLFYYDNALTELWRDRISPYQEMVGRGFDVVVAEATLRYRSAARFDEVLDISMPVAHLGNTSLIIRPEYRVGERLVADGRCGTCSSTRPLWCPSRCRTTFVRRYLVLRRYSTSSTGLPSPKSTSRVLVVWVKPNDS